MTRWRKPRKGDALRFIGPRPNFAKHTHAEAKHRCPWCSREARTCWVMPCLQLQNAIDGEDDAAMLAWGKATGATITKHGEVLRG